MGDNIWLGDRDGVRTPMQWTPDRNAGFSAATPGKLHLPAIQDPVYGYQSVNVEAQLENPSSLLHWTRRMIWARRRHDAFGLGSFADLGGSNPSVLSYAREHELEDGTDRRDRLRQQPVPVPPAGRARPAPVRGHGPDRAARRRPVPGDRRAAVPADPVRLRLLLVPADPARGADRRASCCERDTDTHSTPRSSRTTSRGPAGSAARAGRSRSPTSARIGERPGRAAAGRHPPGRADLRRATEGGARALPGAARPLRAPGAPARPRLRRLVGGRRARLGARLRRPARPRRDGAVAARLRFVYDGEPQNTRRTADESAGLPPAPGPRPRPATRTRRCSPASSPTPRSPSARTR